MAARVGRSRAPPGGSWLTTVGSVRAHPYGNEVAKDIVREHARGGWRLVQVFAPGIAAFGAAKYYELIFERESAEDIPAS